MPAATGKSLETTMTVALCDGSDLSWSTGPVCVQTPDSDKVAAGMGGGGGASWPLIY